MKSVNPDIVIPANYYNEYALLVRTMQQQRVMPKAIYSVLGGAASSYKFLKEFPDAANGIIDCNHWFNPKDKRALDLKKRVEAKGLFFTYEVFMTYTAVRLLADAIERAIGAEAQGRRRAGVGEVGAGQVGRATHELRQGRRQRIPRQEDVDPRVAVGLSIAAVVVTGGLAYLIAFAVIQALVPRMEPARMGE